MKFNFVSTALFIFVFTTLQYSQNNIPDFFTFQFNSSSTVIINSNNDNKVHSIWGEFGTLLQNNGITTNTLSSNTFKISSLIYRISMPTSGIYCSLFMDNDIKLNLFLVPNDTLFVTLDFTDTINVMQNIEFKGRFASINIYLLKKNIDIGNQLSYQRSGVYKSSIDLTAYADSLDSIDNEELKYLNNYNKTNNLPRWYLRYEKNRMAYNSAGKKIIEPSHSEYATSKEVNIPRHYFDFLNNIKIDNKESIILIDYYRFLGNYFYEKYFSQEIKHMNYNNEREKKTIAIDLQCADKYLTGEVEDIYKCFIISNAIINHPEISQFIDSVINESSNRFNNNKYLSFLKDYSKYTLRLNPGDKAPNFYLPDQNNQYVNLTDYKGKVILLNFWFPGCVPCLKEIPFEKKLEEDFKGKNFSLINICMQTPKEYWIKSLSQFNLEGINLFAAGNWENNIIKNYFINRWPHYTLIDKNGNIYSNNFNRPSEGISEDIIKLLSE
ncbi:MAG: TlpA disulfide reductase family protein [Ignavibacteriaceae bacterium]